MSRPAARTLSSSFRSIFRSSHRRRRRLSTPSTRSSHGVVLVTDRHATGTNALGLRPPSIIPFAFGPGSRKPHRAAADRAGATYVELDGPLGLDLDTPDDLLLVEAAAPERLGVA